MKDFFKNGILDKIAWYVILILILFVFQTVFASNLAIYNIKPIVILCAAIFCGLLEGGIAGGIFGAVLGLFCDITSGRAIGFYALALMLCGITAGLVGSKFASRNTGSAFLCYFIISLVYSAIVFLVSILAVTNFQNSLAILKISLLETVYTLLYAIPLYFVMRYGYRRFSIETF